MAQSSKVEVWSPKEIKALVEVRIKYDHLFTGSNGNIAKGWKVVIAKLGSDYNIFRETGNKFQKKWQYEVKKYKDQMEPSAHFTGRSTEDGDSILDLDDDEKAVFEMLAKYHEDKHNINPPALFDSSRPSSSREHNYSSSSYATSQSEYLSEEYLVSDVEAEVEVSSENNEKKGNDTDDEDDDDDEDEAVSVKAKGSKRCKDYYNKKTKKQKKGKKSSGDDWMKEYLEQTRQDRKEEMSQLLGALSKLAGSK